LGVDKLEPERRRQALEQRQAVSERHGLQDEAVLVDESESRKRLREGSAATGEHITPPSRLSGRRGRPGADRAAVRRRDAAVRVPGDNLISLVRGTEVIRNG
jgi:hypothetical protein